MLPVAAGAQLQKFAIHHSLSHAWRLGRAILAARRTKADPVQAVTSQGNGTVLFVGEILPPFPERNCCIEHG